jgi:glucose/arabinose dehydrogenase
MAGDGVDVLNGGAGGDTLSGLGGGDTLRGGGGDDVLYGYSAADTAADSGAIAAQRIASGFASPLFASSAPGDPGRLFVVEKNSGQVRILDLASNTVAATPFIDLPAEALSTGGERGLLGMAFHPDYAANGRFYLYLTRADGDIELREFTRSPAMPTWRTRRPIACSSRSSIRR